MPVGPHGLDAVLHRGLRTVRGGGARRGGIIHRRTALCGGRRSRCAGELLAHVEAAHRTRVQIGELIPRRAHARIIGAAQFIGSPRKTFQPFQKYRGARRARAAAATHRAGR